MSDLVKTVQDIQIDMAEKRLENQKKVNKLQSQISSLQGDVQVANQELALEIARLTAEQTKIQQEG